MFGIGTGELLLLLVIALFVLGPERMPRMARDIGRVVGDLRRTSEELREEFMTADKILSGTVDSAAVRPPTPPTPATNEATVPAPTANAVAGETPFDREMREARERLKAQREA
jgi:sec-independent protein translocase protein TatB